MILILYVTVVVVDDERVSVIFTAVLEPWQLEHDFVLPGVAVATEAAPMTPAVRAAISAIVAMVLFIDSSSSQWLATAQLGAGAQVVTRA